MKNTALIKYFTLAILTLLFFQTKGQKRNNVVVEYAWGTIFWGDIVKDNGTQVLFIRKNTKDTVMLSKEYIKSISADSEQFIMHSNSLYHYARGVYFGTDYNFGKETTQLNAEIGYRINKKITIGAGIGIHHVSADVSGLFLSPTFHPVFMTGRYYLNHNNIRFFLASNVGYSFKNNANRWGRTEKGGFYMQPTIGIHFSSAKKSRLILKVSQYIQNYSGSRDLYSFNDSKNNVVNYNYRFNRFTIGIGWEFY